MDVSVVIPLYNGAAHISEAVRSVLTQEGVDLELLVIDDGSTDGSADLVSRLLTGDDRARLMRFTNGGVAVARNRGLAASTGRYVAFLDQDDVWHPSKLRKQVEHLDRQDGDAVVGCLMNYVGASGRTLGRTGQTPEPIDQSDVRSGRLVPFPLSSALFRSGPLRQAGGSQDFFGATLATAADLELMAIAANHGEVSCLREELGGYRIHRDSVTARSHSTQITAFLYLQEVLREPKYAERVSWEQFEQRYQPTFNVRRMTTVLFRYRQAGLEALDRRWWAAARHLSFAMALSPVYVIRRLARQLGHGKNEEPQDGHRRVF